MSNSKHDAKLSSYSFFPSTFVHQSIFVVLEMQPLFMAANKPTILDGLKEKLQNAISEGKYILIVNYDNAYQSDENGGYVHVPVERQPSSHQLHPELKKLLEDYPNQATIWKQSNSGAIEILEHLKAKKISFSRMCVSGVNVCGSVSSTVKDLSEKLNNNVLIELNNSCCTCDCSSREGICTRISISVLEEHRGVINSSEDKNNILKSALLDENFTQAQTILSQYEIELSDYVEANDCENLKNIKRDLLASLYLVQSGNLKNANIGLNLDLMEQLLDTIQTKLDKISAERCLIM